MFLPGEVHGQRSLAGGSPWGCKESETTERLTLWANEKAESFSCSFPQLLSVQHSPYAEVACFEGYIVLPFIPQAQWPQAHSRCSEEAKGEPTEHSPGESNGNGLIEDGHAMQRLSWF